MRQNERKALIKRIDDDVKRIQQRLDECYAQFQTIEVNFKAQRGEILREIRRQTKRGVQTFLVLKVMRRERRVLAVPVAEWRSIEAKGNRVSRAQKTLGQAGNTNAKRGHMAVFTNTLSMNRKHGWRISDLRSRAHPAEIEVVAEAEGMLLPIRKRVADLTSSAKRLLQRRYQHQLFLDSITLAAPKKTVRQHKIPSWANTESQLSLALEPTKSGELFERPQLRNPDG